MPEKIALEEIAKQNPQIDLAQLQESLELSEALQKEGVSGAGYGIASPHERQRARVHRGQADRRIINLKKMG